VMYCWILVFLQFALAIVLVLTTKWWPIPWVAVLCLLPGVGLSVWAWFSVGLRKLRVHPTPTDDTTLICNGPYAIVRHPMYTGLLWFTLVLVVTQWTLLRGMLYGALLADLILKARVEEIALQSQFTDYCEYHKRVGGLIPKFGRRHRHQHEG
ncbi:MAG: isoprenylcysteine carboxylmethyltransferase family protein, partial [Pirellulaceae bacterium]